MKKQNKVEEVSNFNIESKYEPEEFYREIRDCKKVYAGTTFDRAIPYYKDGLIQIYRRILFSMYKEGYFYKGNTHKSATVYGEVMGRYHPHGDSAIYGAIVTLAGDWNNNEPAIQGKGNWGNVLGDYAAAPRYTECKLSQFFCDIVEEISPNFVNYIPNFDNTLFEAEYIPFKIPYILINGTYGIAESYIASFPCHNVGDVADICIKFVKNKNISNEDLVDGFYPDYPNYGIITNKSEIEQAYKYGTKANIKMKATLEIDRENKKIYIRDLPYGMTLANISAVLIKKTAEKHAVLSKITNVTKIDPTPIRDGQPHIEFEVIFDKNSNILEIARDFERFCTTKTIPLNYILNYGNAEVNNANIRDIVKNWYNTLYITKHRKYGYYSTNNKTKQHIQEGLLTIYDNVDDVINFIKKSNSTKEIIDFLMKKYKLSQVQAEAISNMQLRNLSRVSKTALIESIEKLKQTINELDEKIFHIDDEIIEDLIKIKNKYGRPRRTLVIDEAEESESRTSIPISNGMLMYSHNQYGIFDTQSIVNSKTIMNGLKSYKIDGRNVKEIVGCHNIKNDITGLIIVNTSGIAKRIEVSDIISTNNWIPYEEEILTMIPIYSESDKILAVSDKNKIRIFGVDQISKAKSNIGKVKCMKNLDLDKDCVLFLSESGRYHYIELKEIPELSKNSVGIILNLPDERIDVMQMNKNSEEQTAVVTVIDKELNESFIMRFDASEFEITNRANKGKVLANLDGYRFGNCNLVNIKMKDSKCALIGKYSTSQISIGNLKSCESGIDTKKVPVETIGILQYVI